MGDDKTQSMGTRVGDTSGVEEVTGEENLRNQRPYCQMNCHVCIGVTGLMADMERESLWARC